MKNLVQLTLALVLVFSVAACADDDENSNSNANNTTAADAGGEDDSGTTEQDSGMTAEDMGTANNTTEGPCGADEWLDVTDDSCNACPSAELTCPGVLASTAVDATANTVTITYDPTTVEIQDAIYTGSRSEFEGADEIILPLTINGMIAEGEIVFDLSSEEGTADELFVSNVRLSDGCGNDNDLPLAVRWEPGGNVIEMAACTR